MLFAPSIFWQGCSVQIGKRPELALEWYWYVVPKKVTKQHQLTTPGYFLYRRRYTFDRWCHPGPQKSVDFSGHVTFSQPTKRPARSQGVLQAWFPRHLRPPSKSTSGRLAKAMATKNGEAKMSLETHSPWNTHSPWMVEKMVEKWVLGWKHIANWNTQPMLKVSPACPYRPVQQSSRWLRKAKVKGWSNYSLHHFTMKLLRLGSFFVEGSTFWLPQKYVQLSEK